jgi:hypothetical protein
LSLIGSAIANIVEKNNHELVKTLLLNFEDLYDLEELKNYTDLDIEEMEKIITKLITERELIGILEDGFFIPDPNVDQGSIISPKGLKDYCPRCGKDVQDGDLTCSDCNEDL